MIAAPAPVEVRVRSMRYRDLRAVRRIEREAFGTPWPGREFAFELAKPAASCLAAVIGNDLAGYLVCCPQAGHWNLRNIAVAAAQRRRGVASALLRELLEDEALIGAHCFLEVRESDLGAIALYERFGFRSVGLRPGFYGNDGEDALLMVCSPPLR